MNLTEEQKYYFFSQCMYYFDIRNKEFPNSKREEFIKNIQTYAKEELGETYTEEKVDILPLKISSRTNIIFFPRDDSSQDHIGVEYCDILLFNPEDFIYSKINTKYGIKELFSKSEIPTSVSLMDGFICITIFEGATLQMDSSHRVFLHLLPYEYKAPLELNIEQLEYYITHNPTIFAGFEV